jgi:hypothetical protein
MKRIQADNQEKRSEPAMDSDKQRSKKKTSGELGGEGFSSVVAFKWRHHPTRTCHHT